VLIAHIGQRPPNRFPIPSSTHLGLGMPNPIAASATFPARARQPAAPISLPAAPGIFQSRARFAPSGEPFQLD